MIETFIYLFPFLFRKASRIVSSNQTQLTNKKLHGFSRGHTAWHLTRDSKSVRVVRLILLCVGMRNFVLRSSSYGKARGIQAGAKQRT
jgi:hypothetical protein